MATRPNAASSFDGCTRNPPLSESPVVGSQEVQHTCGFYPVTRSNLKGSGSSDLGLERAMGFEPTTTCLGSKDSTTELRPLAESNPTLGHEPSQSSVVIGQSGKRNGGSSHRPSSALTIDIAIPSAPPTQTFYGRPSGDRLARPQSITQHWRRSVSVHRPLSPPG